MQSTAPSCTWLWVWLIFFSIQANSNSRWVTSDCQLTEYCHRDLSHWDTSAVHSQAAGMLLILPHKTFVSCFSSSSTQISYHFKESKTRNGANEGKLKMRRNVIHRWWNERESSSKISREIEWLKIDVTTWVCELNSLKGILISALLACKMCVIITRAGMCLLREKTKWRLKKKG